VRSTAITLWQRSQPHMRKDAVDLTPLSAQWCFFLGTRFEHSEKTRLFLAVAGNSIVRGGERAHDA
jgi:hypothetical protein